MRFCKLCAELNSAVSREAWNKPLKQTDNFAVIPSLGALVEGWLLIVPKMHYISMGALPESLRAEADELESEMRSTLRTRYRQHVISFEHGPSSEYHGTGCGVDHAHLHLVPLNCDLRALSAAFMPHDVEWMPGNWEEREYAYQSGLDYLFLRGEHESNGAIAVCADFGSQVFRRAIATAIGVPHEYSWRQYQRLDTVNETIRSVSAALDERSIRGVEHVA